MKHIKTLSLLCMLAGGAYAQTQHLKGSDTLAPFSRDVIRTLGLGSGNDPLVTPCPDTDLLCYDGGGSGLGYGAGGSGNARVTGQGLNPASRPVNSGDQTLAHSNNLEFDDPQCEVARDGIALVVNDGNDLQQAIQTTIGDIFSCAADSGGNPYAGFWDQVGSSLGHVAINKYTRDGVSGTTDVFTKLVQHHDANGAVVNFPGVPSPPDPNYWDINFPGCITQVFFGDDATQFIAAAVANDTNGIGYAGLPVIITGNHALAICNDQGVDCTDPTNFFYPNSDTIEAGQYYLGRPLFFARVHGFNGVPYSLPPSQQTMYDWACTSDTRCDDETPVACRNEFFPSAACYAGGSRCP